ncbi:MAG: helix-turn-helix transcriptional regulator [Thermoanaerobaculia bacterium]|nr:helix-turn-helix transcriptional regulator [Thermoanaerobaculia bacterium]
MTSNSTQQSERTFGDLVRAWRSARRLSQLDLAGAADVSARHVSFLETGRANPSREMIERLAEALEIPRRERNALLLSAGFAPRFPKRSLDDPVLSPAERGVRFLLDSHDPYPAFVVDRLWNLVLSNEAHRVLLRWLLGYTPNEQNLLRLVVAPDLLKPFIRNWQTVTQFLMRRLEQHLALPEADGSLEELYRELVRLPGVDDARRSSVDLDPHGVLVPFELEAHGRRLSWFSTLARFGSAVDITLEEILIECLHPHGRRNGTNSSGDRCRGLGG